MRRASLIIAAVAASFALCLTACSPSIEPEPRTTFDSSGVAAAPVAPVTPRTESPSVVTPPIVPSSTDKIQQDQKEKFTYMQDPDRLERFEQSGYAVAKVKFAKDIMAGKYGQPTVERTSLFHEPALMVSVGGIDETDVLYAWYFVYLDESDSPNYSTVTNIAAKLPGREYFSITDTVHDWPTVINDVSVDLQYGVAYGESRLSISKETCIWPKVEAEWQFCEELTQGTSTAEDLLATELYTLTLMAEAMSVLYGTEWYKG